tara:strand:+ start:336 stop:515 length:180 start_codon:yes stop_codon:yes gene_type:complete
MDLLVRAGSNNRSNHEPHRVQYHRDQDVQHHKHKFVQNSGDPRANGDANRACGDRWDCE